MTPNAASPTDQSHVPVRFDWGERGLAAIGPGCRAVVIVDVLTFSTCVDVATGRGATVLPYRWRDSTATEFARKHEALLAATKRDLRRYSLSPQSLSTIPAGTRLVLPSPNGSTLSVRAARMATTIAACLRNAAAVARFVRSLDGPAAVIAAGERWPDGDLRPAWEDLVGAGAVIARLPRPWSPEAQAAAAAYRSIRGDFLSRMQLSSSGRELIDAGFAADLEIAAAVGISRCVPVLTGDAYLAQEP